MQGQEVSGRTPLQIPLQPGLTNGQPVLSDDNQRVLTGEIVHAKDVAPQPLPPRGPCGSPDPGQGCWGLDIKLTIPLLVLAGALILLLLYRLLQLRHRLRVAQASDALLYGFYHATYTLKDPGLPQVMPANGDAQQVPEPLPGVPPPLPVGPTPIASVPPSPGSPPPSLPPPPPRVLPPPPLVPPPPRPATPPPLMALPRPLPVIHTTPPPLMALPRPLPVIHTTPPSPQPSGGVGADVEVYSRIGTFRLSRLSSLSQTQVVLFEHSAL